MGMQDSEPTESVISMGIAANAMLGELVDLLIKKQIISRNELMNAISMARRRVNTGADRSDHHGDADSLLEALQKRFPVV